MLIRLHWKTKQVLVSTNSVAESEVKQNFVYLEEEWFMWSHPYSKGLKHTLYDNDEKKMNACVTVLALILLSTFYWWLPFDFLWIQKSPVWWITVWWVKYFGKKVVCCWHRIWWKSLLAQSSYFFLVLQYLSSFHLLVWLYFLWIYNCPLKKRLYCNFKANFAEKENFEPIGDIENSSHSAVKAFATLESK